MEAWQETSQADQNADEAEGFIQDAPHPSETILTRDGEEAQEEFVIDADEGNKPPSRSVSSTQRHLRKNRKSRRYVTPQSIENVYKTLSNVQAADINPPPSQLFLSPRSAEACLKLGVNPEVLKIRDLDSFWEPELDPAIQRLRHEAYSMRRHEIMEELRHERRRMINDGVRRGQTHGGAGSAGGALTAEQLLAAQEAGNSTLVENERKRMAKMRQRQEKELEQMLQFETKMGEVQDELKRREAIQKEREDARQRAKQKRMREMAIERYKRDLRRKAMEDAEEQQRARLAAEHFAREQERIHKEQLAETRNKKLARMKDEERKRKRLEHQLATQRVFDEQQRKIKERMADMEIANKRREEAMERKRAEDAKRLQERRDQIEERIQRNLRMAQEAEEKRKADFFERQAWHEKLRQDAEMQKAREREIHRQKMELKEQQRRYTLAKTREEEEKMKKNILQQIESEEIKLFRVRELRGRELKFQAERSRLNKQLKMENVERLRRVREYKKLETMRRIREHNARVEQMLQKRQDIIAERKRLALQSKIQKDNIVEVINRAKSNGAQATKILEKLITEGTQKKRRSKRLKKKKKKGNNAFNSQSAPTIRSMTAHSAPESSPQDDLGPMPDAPSLHKPKQETKPRPYVSPYETA